MNECYSNSQQQELFIKTTIDIESQTSEKTGFAGFFEVMLRRFFTFVFLFSAVPIYLIACLSMGLALTPGIYLFQFISGLNLEPLFLRYLTFGIGISAGYFLYGLSLVFILPTVVFIFRAYPKPSRTSLYSVESYRWFFHNCMLFIIRLSFLDVITPSPVNNLFFKLMGMKIGKKVHINTSYITDPCLISIGDRTVVGGSATIIAHYGQKGVMIIAPVKIGAKVTIGLRAIIFGGVEIGEGASVMPNSVVLPKTIIPAGEIWGGVPAQKMDFPAKNLG